MGGSVKRGSEPRNRQRKSWECSELDELMIDAIDLTRRSPEGKVIRSFDGKQGNLESGS